HAPPRRTSLSLSYASGDTRRLRSFPTRRSSDLYGRNRAALCLLGRRRFPCRPRRPFHGWKWGKSRLPKKNQKSSKSLLTHPGARSEEHTSELQSRENLVCRLLLEKKNKTRTQHN